VKTFEDLMSEAVEIGIENGGVVAPLLAAELIREHPKQAGEYLTSHAQAFITIAIGKLMHRANRHASAGETTLSMRHALDGSYRRVADWTGVEHRQMAESYEARSKRFAMFAAFHRAIAKKVGARRTADVLNEEQYAALLARYDHTDERGAPHERVREVQG
jgi:hypothetical protein